jgi:hypothetical protein
MSKLLGGVSGALAAAAISACASSSSDIRASYVSPLQYQGYTCQQISAEAARISSHAAEVAGVQDQKRTNDQVATGVAIVVFWPAAFFVGGDGPAAVELARLKGEYEALEKMAVEKNCSVQFRSS